MPTKKRALLAIVGIVQGGIGVITREPRGEARLVGDEDVIGHVGVLARV